MRTRRRRLRLHLHHIRSYDKFTSEGMNYFYGDLHDFFEKTLPTEYGGGLGDYQLVAEEDEIAVRRASLCVYIRKRAISIRPMFNAGP